MSTSRYHAPSRTLALLLLAGAGLLPGAAAAQTLDSQYQNLLYAKCLNMNFQRDQNANLLPGQAGLRLTAYCNGTFALPSGVGESHGATTGFGQTAGITDQAARRRKAAGDDEKQAASSADEFELFAANQYSVYAGLNAAREEQDPTAFEGSHRSDTLGVSLGVDRRLGTKGVFGLSLQAENLDGDMDDGGKFEHRAYGAMLYGSWLPTPAAFIDLAAGWTTRNVETRRIVAFKGVFIFYDQVPPREVPFFYIDPAVAASDVDQQDKLAEARAGYDFSFGRYSIGPRFAGSYRETDIDGAFESGDTPMTLVIDKQVEKSLRAGAGLQASCVFNTESAVWVLQLNGDWWHEFKDDQRYMTAHLAEDLRAEPDQLRYQNQPPDRSTFTARTSLSVTMPRGWSGFASVDALLGHSYLSRYGAAIGLRKEL